ncbi:CHAP domain-containing protein [Bifidobacterium sp. 82T10]|uniref:CHAP domain-containing protein n=2 Tax=Bifidobacterium miconis TaxID=2834435 RepID=A0ABS6WCQ0_9BIFI|nr:CHAP domain-containing protein [Bifidobacterium miconis]MBW3091815.1 CHAP domain-containing protein [Bifidobacterium miconis]
MALCAAMAVGTVVAPVPVANADTYAELLDARAQKQASAQREAELKSQLAGVSSQLADKIVELDTLTNVKIPAAQAAVNKANQQAAVAKAEAEAMASRLDAAKKDKATLEEEIKKTGKDYDDAHAAVAQMARESMHGSNASDVMSVVTGSTSTKEFVNAMQTRDALSRTESNAASEAAVSLNTSMNRGERLAAIEKTIAELKVKADETAAAAETAAANAQSERDALDKLREEGEAKRTELESQQSQITDASAKQAAQTVLLDSQIDSLNRKYAAEQAAAAAKPTVGPQGTTKPAGSVSTNTGANTNANTNSGSNSGGSSSNANTNTNTNVNTNTGGTTSGGSTSGSSSSAGTSGGQGTSNGDSGNAYAGGQCTWYAYNRRKEMGIGTPSYLGNGGDWAANAPSYGLRVDSTPQVGAALSFARGQDGADGTYGHVAVVEAVNSDGTFLISEMNVQGLYVVSYRTLTNNGQYLFVH